MGTDGAAATAALFAPVPQVADHPAVRAATRLADEVLAPHAAEADDPARGVDPAHLALPADATPAVMGLLRRVLLALARVGPERGRPEAVDTALALAGRAAPLRDEAYALLTEVPAGERIPERTALRGS